MKRLTILVPDGQSNLSTVTTILGVYDIFSTANTYWEKKVRERYLKLSWLAFQKTCSTHWAHADTFRSAFPNVNLKEDKFKLADGLLSIFIHCRAYID
jgi:hypothetical protein